MSTYRLHYFPESGNSYKLALMLTLCEQSFDLVWTDYFGGVTGSPEWRSTLNAMGEIPVLEDGGEKLTQTGAILLHLASRHGQFGPKDDKQKFHINRWLMWDNHKLTSYIATYRFYRTFLPETHPAILAFQRKRAEDALGILELHLRDRQFVIGAKPSIADLSMCGYLYFPSEETGFELPSSHPSVAAWLDRLSQIPRWREPYELLPGQRQNSPLR